MSKKNKIQLSIGPGPGAYVLPPTIGHKSHDLRKFRKPEYSFGYRPKIDYKSEGPGPGQYDINALTRYGKKTHPAYIGKRLQPPSIEKIPGPGDYVNLNIYKRKSPGFHMGKRIVVDFKDQKPAPNLYKIPESFGSKRSNVYKQRSPGFSMSFRHPELINDKSPGPQRYDVKFMDCKLGTTMKDRYRGVRADKTPAPNAYNKIQNYKPGDKSPAYSFGIRHTNFAPPMIIEGDNC